MANKEKYVIDKMKHGYQLLYTSRRLRLFNGREYLPLDVALIRTLKKNNVIIFDRKNTAGEEIYKLNDSTKWRNTTVQTVKSSKNEDVFDDVDSMNDEMGEMSLEEE